VKAATLHRSDFVQQNAANTKSNRFFTASSCSALICSSWVCHSDWKEQIATVATDAKELDALLEV
jgi:hypothetical protein